MTSLQTLEMLLLDHLRQKNSLITPKIPLKFIAYTYGYEKKMNINNQTSFLENLKLWGFKTNPFNKKIIGS